MWDIIGGIFLLYHLCTIYEFTYLHTDLVVTSFQFSPFDIFCPQRVLGPLDVTLGPNTLKDAQQGTVMPCKAQNALADESNRFQEGRFLIVSYGVNIGILISKWHFGIAAESIREKNTATCTQSFETIP